MKYVAEIVSHITVEAQNREQAEFRINAILGNMKSMFEGSDVTFHTNSINRKHYHHMPHYFQSPAHGRLRHQHINVSRLTPGCAFAFWNRQTDNLYLYIKGNLDTWVIERWSDSHPDDKQTGDSLVDGKRIEDDFIVVEQLDASNDHNPNAGGYVVGMETIADSKSRIRQFHPNATLIGYKGDE